MMIKPASCLFLLLLVSCKISKNQPEAATDYFEGVLEYQIEYESFTEILSTEDMTRTMPDRKLMYFRNGNAVTDFFLNDSLVKRNWFDQSTNFNYYYQFGSDTLYYSDPSVTDFTTDALVQSEGETILNHPTEKIKILIRGKKGTYFENHEGKLELYLSLDFPIDPSWYKNVAEFDYYKTVTRVPGITLKMNHVIYNYSKTTSTATKIEWKEVNLDLSVDSTKVLVRI